MPHYLDSRHYLEGLTADAVAQARKAGLRSQDTFNDRFLQYWFGEWTGEPAGPSDAPDRQPAAGRMEVVEGS